MMVRARACGAILFLCLLAAVGCGDKADVYNISIPAAKASSDETVVSFEISIIAGQVQGVSRVPVGWNVAIENNNNWRSVIRANTSIGAAAMAGDELGRIVFSVRRNEYGGNKFDVSGKLTLVKAFGNPRHLPLNMVDFSLNGTD